MTTHGAIVFPVVMAALAEQGRQPPTRVLTTFDDDEALVDSLRAGAIELGYLP